MSWANWIPAITSSTLLAGIGYVLSAAYKAAFEKSVQHSFDRKLEELRATIRQNDEQVAALRGGALSGLVSRQGNLDRRRLEAVERVWAETVSFARYRNLSMMTGAMDIILKSAAGTGRDAQKTRELAEMMLNTAGLGELEPANYTADKERPFLDPVCWALFSAYRQCSMYPAMLFQLAKVGVGPEILESSSSMLRALKAVLPEHAEYIEEQGLGSLHQLLQPLEDRLLAAFNASLSGRESSEVAVRHAAEIIGKVQEADTAIRAGRNRVADTSALG
ncbi:hypothetical protein [Caulobacter sp. DWP3-1-3b2]|uniref:hypothetical protein n=1 Tax=Caulobacter sp. DWP3-1-3b2 TaxID=2804643 RepID=UPI003CE93F05